MLVVEACWTLLGPFIYSIMEKAKEGTERERANLNCTSVRKIKSTILLKANSIPAGQRPPKFP